MAYVVSSPEYSFVQFGSSSETNARTGCCGGSFCLPLVLESDWHFQVQVTSETILESDILMANAAPQLLLLRGTGNTDDTIAANTLLNFATASGLLFQKFRTGEKEVTYLWKNDLTGLTGHIAIDECFQLAFVTYSGQKIFSNCFKRLAASCYLSRIEYINEEDSYGFRYCNVDDSANRARLPFYVNKPQYIDEEEVYMKSNGELKVTMSISKKEFPAEFDFAPDRIHGCMKMALSHDVVTVDCDRYEGAVRKSGGYEIEWDEPTDCMAPAKFKVNVTPFDARNNNCAGCLEVDNGPCEGIITGDISGLTATTVTIDINNTGGVPANGYNYHLVRIDPPSNYVQLFATQNVADGPLTFTDYLTSGNDYALILVALCAGGGSQYAEIPFTTP